MAEMTEARRREIEAWMYSEVGSATYDRYRQIFDALETAEAELRLARELLRRVRRDGGFLGLSDDALVNAMAAYDGDGWTDEEQAALAAIRREVEEGRDNGS